MNKQAILYARSATGDNEALVRQLELCREWAQANDYTVVSEYSEIASGFAVALPERDKAMVQAQKEGAVLICAGPSRLTRNLNRYVRCMTGCKRQNLPVIFVDKGIVRAEDELNDPWRLLRGYLVRMTRS